jgi:hypothetical protein
MSPGLDTRTTRHKTKTGVIAGAMTPVGRSDCGSDRRVRGPGEQLPESAQLIRSTSVRQDSVTTARSGTAGRSTAAGSTDVIAAGPLVTMTALEQAAATAEQPTTMMLATAGLRAAGVSTGSRTGVGTRSRTAADVGTRSRTGVGTRSRTAGLGAAGRSRSATAGGATVVAPLVMAAEQTGVSAVHAGDDCEGGDDCRPLHLEISLTFGLIA